MTDDSQVSNQAPPVGRVLGTEESTPLKFWVGLAPEQYLQLDDVIITERELPDGRKVTMSGVVTGVRALQEGAHFDSDVFLISEGILPAQTVEAAEVLTTRVEPEVFVPPLPGSATRRATGAERDHALYFDQMDAKLPIGTGRDGEVLFANLEFIDGTRGAHINISGISGVATKTTYATFLLYGLFHSNILGPERLNTKALIFNVKGEDLLFLDHDNVKLKQSDREKYTKLGLPVGAFDSVGIYAPTRRGDSTGRPDVSSRTEGVNSYYWTLEEFCKQELFPFVFADAEDDRNQYTMVVHNVTAMLHRDGQSVGDDGAWKIDGTVLRRWEDLVDLLVDRLSDDATRPLWGGPAVGMGTVNAFIRRLLSSTKPLSALIRSDLEANDRHSIKTSDSKVTVVDLHNLPDRAKRFVVGVTIRQAFQEKEESGQAKPLLFLVLDELNKYAPREGNSPIKEILLDVAERGRSLGIILIGAQQTASEVERRIIGNSAIRVVGRLDAAEATRPEYGFLPASHRGRATIAKPGTMFVSQPEIPVPLVVEFPFPAWATRPAEKGANPHSSRPDNPFSGFPSTELEE